MHLPNIQVIMGSPPAIAHVRARRARPVHLPARAPLPPRRYGAGCLSHPRSPAGLHDDAWSTTAVY